MRQIINIAIYVLLIVGVIGFTFDEIDNNNDIEIKR
jgi:hypothetical protein